MLKSGPSKQATVSESGNEIVIRANYELFVLTLSALQVTNSFLIVLLRNANADRIPMIVNGGLAIFFFWMHYTACGRHPIGDGFSFSITDT